MYTVRATESIRDKDGIDFSVLVAIGDNEHEYEVSLPTNYYHKITNDACTKKDFVEKAFRFLLAHEPPERILSTFTIPKIASYFPNFEKEVLSY